MMNMKKLLALLLAIVMVVGMFPMNVFAENEEPAHLDSCTEGCTGCECVCHQVNPASDDPAEPQSPADNCPNCDNADCIGCDGEAKLQNDGGEAKDEVCETCQKDPCECKGEVCETCQKDPCECKSEVCETCQKDPCECKSEVCETCQKDPCECKSEVCETCQKDPCECKSEVCETCQKNPCECKNTEETKCALCESTEHATNQCSLFCGFCQKVPCECVSCDKCGVKNGHTDKCELKPCEKCEKNPCACEAEETFVQKLLACENLKELFDTFNADADAAYALTLDELEKVEAFAAALYAALENPTDDDEDYYIELTYIFELLRELKEDAEPEECSCGALNGNHAENCPLNDDFDYDEVNKPNLFALPKGSSGTGELGFDKALLIDDDGNMSLRLETYTVGSTTIKPTEIVSIIDQSGSMYAAVDGPDSYWTYSEFLKNADKSKGAYEGYYMVVAENVNYNYVETYLCKNSSNKTIPLNQYNGHTHTQYCKKSYWVKGTCKDVNNNHICDDLDAGNKCTHVDNSGTRYRSYKYAAALVRYNSSTNKWQRSHQVSIGGNYNTVSTDYNDLSLATVFASYFTGMGWSDLTGTECYIAENSDVYKNAKYFKSIYGATVDALITFVQEIQNIESCSMSIVGFSSPASYGYQWKPNEDVVNADGSVTFKYGGSSYGGTGLFVNGEFVHSNSLTNESYAASFNSLNTQAGLNKISSSINSILTNYNITTTQEGFMLANKVLAAGNPDANKVVVLFTDGIPTAHYPDGSNQAVSGSPYTTEDHMNAAIKEAKKTKEIAHVYAFGPSGMDSYANFMDKLSSNWPDATNLTNGTKTGTDYYGIASNSEHLKKMFKELGEKIFNDSKLLNKEAVVKDIITPYFVIPDGAGSAVDQISAYKVPYTENGSGGYSFNDSAKTKLTVGEGKDVQITVAVDNETQLTTVNVKGFDYAANSIDTTSGGGAKLQIIIPIEVKPDFLGGNKVVTNGEESGVYASDGTPVGIFDVPAVNIPVKNIIPASAPGKIYLSQKAEIPHIANVGWFRYDSNGDGKIDDSDVLKQTDGINNAYVDITYTIADKSFTGMAEDYSNVLQYTLVAGTDCTGTTGGTNGWTGRLPQNPTLTDDATYYLRASVTPTTQPTDGVTGTKNYAQQTISVYKPEVTFQDSKINLGETANYATQNLLTVVWKHGDTEADTITMGPAPILTYTYVPEQSDFKSDTAVQVTSITAGYGDQTVNDYKHIVDSTLPLLDHVKFYRMPCTFSDCDMHGKTENQPVVTEDVDTWVNFIVHLNTFDIKIVKTGWNSLEPDQSYIFNVIGPSGSNIDLDVMIKQNGHVILKGVPVGTYTVKEDTNWSWRYDPKGGAEKIVSASSAVDGMATVTFENERNDIYWLDGNDYVNNVFGQAS